LFLRLFVPVLLAGLTFGAVGSMWMARVMRATLPAIGPNRLFAVGARGDRLGRLRAQRGLALARRVAQTDPAFLLRSE
jgi:hypothetical protein